MESRISALCGKNCLFRESGRQTTVCIVTARVGGVDNGVDEIQMVIAAYQHVAIDGVKDVVLTVGVVFAIVFGMETEAQELVVNLLLGGEAGFVDIGLH